MLSAKDFLASHHTAGQHQQAEQARLLAAAKRDKYKLAELAAGRLVRIRMEYPGEEPITALYPARVAAYACRLLGEPQPTARGGVRVTLTTQNRQSAAYYPELAAHRATMALLHHARAVTKAERRRARAQPGR
ncbi:hypothetical protein E4631_06135 [Hymenobacter sp. UV11]|uniref:hypothetical protein n=1 Tax=Hymenobacter sp. UV11 TaxID=1849735 RepID=UPI00105D956E|nr:hypothetical protein [Hymenobacter sp. UV11]TDN38267.1 hypothetical protein A8B98_25000 [Hymenobacter sp. UV11]TFZ67556.1 hypothetical protein E4631_06135 [Hymenobacter sp. UV11]